VTELACRPAGRAVVCTAPIVGGRTPAALNWSRWIARCPAPYCRGAAALDYGQTTAVCLEPWCGAVADVVWPANLPDIEYLVALRPDPTTRNWEPGETIHDLLADNMLHGIVPPGPLDGGPLLALLGDRIVGGTALPAGFQPRSIDA